MLTVFCSLEKANALLLDELQQRELEYNTLQDDVRDLNERLVKFRDEHSQELSKFDLHYENTPIQYAEIFRSVKIEEKKYW